ncbi:succinyl-diaminopimelate desuccinylase [Elongatibacter sediminis]|uniref:Succinyl-diaminopimelate desuccinylase n=1 Tax=Elongatibacter sediminis TaxID=3119006 RepID=A0AAW9RAD5_9GAMM
MSQSPVVELTRELVERASVTPDDAGCQQLIARRLIPLGFEARWFHCGEVSNVLLTRGRGSPSLWFLGHTDVVPPGADEQWTVPPFEPAERDGCLYGRGVADMKGAVAAMIVALEAFARQTPDTASGQVGLLLTSDEEGDAVDGIVRVAEVLSEQGGAPDHCLVGEPSSIERLGDSVRIGRRGSIHGRLRVDGVQGHSAFPHLVDNPAHRLAPFLTELVETRWDDGNDDFPATSCQVAWIRAGQGARNVTPADATVQFNLRHCPESTSRELHDRIEAMICRHGIERYEFTWEVMGEPFHSAPGALRGAVVGACRDVLGVEPDLNTGGGTSDGRYIAPLGSEVLELGLLNATIHKVDENTPTGDLDRLADAYTEILRRVFA